MSLEIRLPSFDTCEKSCQFQIRQISYNETDKLLDLRTSLSNHISGLKRRSRLMRTLRQGIDQHTTQSVRDHWPRKPSEDLKRKILTMFKEATSSATLKTFVCACCAEKMSFVLSPRTYGCPSFLFIVSRKSFLRISHRTCAVKTVTLCCFLAAWIGLKTEIIKWHYVRSAAHVWRTISIILDVCRIL